MGSVLIMSDADFAGEGTERSCSGYGIWFRAISNGGWYLAECRLRKQAVVALSSGESELYAQTAGIQAGCGMENALKEMGFNEGQLIIGCDSAAAIHMLRR